MSALPTQLLDSNFGSSPLCLLAGAALTTYVLDEEGDTAAAATLRTARGLAEQAARHMQEVVQIAQGPTEKGLERAMQLAGEIADLAAQIDQEADVAREAAATLAAEYEELHSQLEALSRGRMSRRGAEFLSALQLCREKRAPAEAAERAADAAEWLHDQTKDLRNHVDAIVGDITEELERKPKRSRRAQTPSLGTPLPPRQRRGAARSRENRNPRADPAAPTSTAREQARRKSTRSVAASGGASASPPPTTSTRAGRRPANPRAG